MEQQSNNRPLSGIFDMLRTISIVLLALHFYLVCYAAFAEWGLASPFSDRLFTNLGRTGLFADFHRPRLFALGALALSLFGCRGKGKNRPAPLKVIIYFLAGAALYFAAPLFFYGSFEPATTAIGYMGTTGLGYILFLHSGSLIAWFRRNPSRGDIFNSLNESFPQEQRLLEDEFSINLPTLYQYDGRTKKGWINIDPFRGLLVMGSAGSAKTWCVIRSIIRQHLKKGYTMVVYDFKYDDLTRLTWHYYHQYKSSYAKKPNFYVINFDDLSRSHRCNPLDASVIREMADAAESARTILMGLNTDWIHRQGDFWIESAIAFMTALIWYLRRYEGGKYCTLPHVIELLQVDYADLFSILRAEPEISTHINSFLSAYMHGVKETLDNQVSSLKIALTRLSSPSLYYILTGNDLTLDINNPKAPKILCLGSNPRVSTTYGAVISLYITAINRMVNRKGGLKSSHVYDEMATVRIHQLSELLATGRSNKVAVTMCVQDASQLRLNYGRTQADVILNLPGSIISGQVGGDTARLLSERIGKVVQERHSVHEGSSNAGGSGSTLWSGTSPSVSVTRSTQLDYAVPVSRIATLSSGEFVGLVADNPRAPILHKAFHARILPDPAPTTVPDQGSAASRSSRRPHSASNSPGPTSDASAILKPLPIIRQVSPADVQAQYAAVRSDIAALVSSELTRMLQTPGLAELILK